MRSELSNSILRLILIKAKMNIFTVLSQGASRLHEPSMSAFLGYLLDSSKDHGLNDTFVRTFLRLVDADRFAPVLAADYIKSAVELESKYDYEGGVRSIDIEVTVSIDRNPAFRLMIENKINIGAANAKHWLNIIVPSWMTSTATVAPKICTSFL